MIGILVPRDHHHDGSVLQLFASDADAGVVRHRDLRVDLLTRTTNERHEREQNNTESDHLLLLAPKAL